MLKQMTKTRKFKDSRITGTKDGWGVITVTYGFDVDFAKRCNQRPYFAITAEVKTVRGRNVSFGMQHDLISRFFPSLRPLLKWHLTNDDANPMHYVANGAYWLESALGISQWERKSYDPDPLEAFRHTTVHGVLPDDGQQLAEFLARWDWVGTLQSDFVLKAIRAELKTDVSNWLIARAAALKSAFETDMRAAGLML